MPRCYVLLGPSQETRDPANRNVLMKPSQPELARTSHPTSLASSFGSAALAGLLTLGLLGCPEDPKPDPPACTPGTQDCACREGSCDEGLICRTDLCVTAPTQTGLSIGNEQARACELLLTGVDDQVEVAFGSAIKGQAIREGERLAVSFSATADQAISADQVNVSRDDGASLAGLQIERARCFDRNGSVIDGAGVSWARGGTR